MDNSATRSIIRRSDEFLLELYAMCLAKREAQMNESDVEEMLELTETTLRNVDGRDLFCQQVRDFSKILMEIIVSSEACTLLETMREDLLSMLSECELPLAQLNIMRLQFTLGRLDFLLDAQEQARVGFLEAARNGLPTAMAYYNLAMTYAADMDLDASERKEHTTRFLQMIVDSEGVNSDPGMDAASHIKLIERSEFL
jgi:hypothetical protein